MGSSRRTRASPRRSRREKRRRAPRWRLPFDDFQLGAVGIAAQPEAGRLYANIGGSFSVEALVDVTVRDVVPTPDDLASIASVFRGVADLVPSAADLLTCERVSVGFGIDAVPVELIVE